MKALSIRQPWADLILQGKKTLELRTWTVSHRGLLAIHASQTIDEAACQEHGIDPHQLSTGVVIGIVQLDEIIELDEASFVNRRSDHLYSGQFKPPVYGWSVSTPRSLAQPVPYTGRMGLFNVPDDLIEKVGEPFVKEPASAEQLILDSRLPFELQVRAEPGSNPMLASYRLALFQKPVTPPVMQQAFTYFAPPQRQMICELGGTALKATADAILEALRLNGYAATDLGVRRKEPFRLSEESGVRLALIFLAVRPISKVSRIEEISRGIRAMTSEELYFWFAKCTGTSSSDRAQRALRLLLSEE